MDGIHLMATAMHAAKDRLDVAASNLANVSTTGFEKRVSDVRLSGAGLVATSRIDTTPGPLRRTGRSLDLAVAGSGGFFVREPSGAVSVVRSGSFARDAGGRLADDRGRVLLGVRGPLVARADCTIDARGVVSDGGSPVGRVRLTPGASLQSGFLESPNVDGVREMVDVLAAQRAFETAQKTLSAIDEARQKDVNDVARVKS